MDERLSKLQQQFGLPDELQGRPLSEFELIENVPLIDSFEDEDINATPEFLQKVVKVNNNRTMDTGDMSPLVLGHTDDDKPESEQPPIAGWAFGYSYKPDFGKINPRPAVLGCFLIHKSLAKTIREKFPRRSVEVFKDGLIDPIALLGATTPRRSLTLLSRSESNEKAIALASRKKQPRWRFQSDEDPEIDSKLCDPQDKLCDPSTRKLEMADSGLNEQQVADIVTKAIAATPQMQMLSRLMDDEDPQMLEEDDQSSEDQTPPAPPTPPADDTENTDEVQMEDPAAPVEGGPKPDPEEVSEVVQALVDAASPDEVHAALARLRNNQTAVRLRRMFGHKLQPAKLRKTSPQSSAGNSDRAQLELRQLKTKLSRMEAEQKALKLESEQNKTRLRHESRKADLTHLSEGEGYDFDLAEEFDYCKDMTDSQYKAHLQRIEKNYNRVPIGAPPVRLAAFRTDSPGDDNLTSRRDDDRMHAEKVKLARKKRQDAYQSGRQLTMEQAYREVEDELNSAAAS